MKKLFLLLTVFVCFLAGAQKVNYTFNPVETKFIIGYLASDDLKGRAVFTPEIDKAANFIAEHFKKAGLKTFNNSENYLQTFAMVSPKLKELTATINNEKIAAERVIPITGARELVVTEKSGYEVTRISAGGNLFREAVANFQSGKNRIVLVDSSFADNFKRLTFLSRNFLNTGVSTIFILGNPGMQHFSIKALQDVSERKLSNVAGVLPGKSRPDEYVIFSAHYDHMGIGKPENGDSIYNGANDDASGTTAIMMLADYFAKQDNNARSIIFVAFTAEETGGFGSRYFSRVVEPKKVMAMLNIEMIGTESKWGRNSAYITGFDKSNLGEILQKNLAGSGFNFNPDPYPEQQLFYRSDNATLAALGVPAHTISTSKMDNEPYYHKPGDEVKTLDLANMTEIIKSIAISAASIISAKDTPSRVNTGDLR